MLCLHADIETFLGDWLIAADGVIEDQQIDVVTAAAVVAVDVVTLSGYADICRDELASGWDLEISGSLLFAFPVDSALKGSAVGLKQLRAKWVVELEGFAVSNGECDRKSLGFCLSEFKLDLVATGARLAGGDFKHLLRSFRTVTFGWP